MCGHVFKDKSEKIVHRINPKKYIKKLNVIVVCPHCKAKILKAGIMRSDLNTDILNSYFTDYTRDDRHTVLEKVFKYLISTT